MKPTWQLTTPRLILRSPNESDLTPMIALGADVDVMRYIGKGQTQTAEQAAGWHAAMLRDAFNGQPGVLPRWLIVEKPDTHDWIGLAVLQPLNATHAAASGEGTTPEVGYRLAKEHWGKGYASEAGAALVKYGRETMNFPRLVLIADARNIASNRVAEKIGFIYERTYGWDGLEINLHAINK